MRDTTSQGRRRKNNDASLTAYRGSLLMGTDFVNVRGTLM